jgi:hypothetical protein
MPVFRIRTLTPTYSHINREVGLLVRWWIRAFGWSDRAPRRRYSDRTAPPPQCRHAHLRAPCRGLRHYPPRGAGRAPSDHPGLGPEGVSVPTSVPTAGGDVWVWEGIAILSTGDSPILTRPFRPLRSPETRPQRPLWSSRPGSSPGPGTTKCPLNIGAFVRWGTRWYGLPQRQSLCRTRACAAHSGAGGAGRAGIKALR